ncbi:hypothetical protein ASE26_24135 [Duganella sp. Root198D2]|nr:MULTISPECIES: hypothetical protein [unclassified Duganella]KQV49119.1 hypothetical protein ASD07_29800 [Duganella sp. Root336D2]KRB99063.1 hypothetical protein ASE26_24135 [Duganella sp. Root198D2]
MMKPRISLFAEHEREDRRSKIGDPLVGLTKHVDFEARPPVSMLPHHAHRASKAAAHHIQRC